MRDIIPQAPVDGRQSLRSLAIRRGVGRLLQRLNFAFVAELGLPDGRRVDMMALGPKGEIWIIEIKSSVADFRSDRKWQDYAAFCDRLYFATSADVPAAIFPEAAGLIVADDYGAACVREAPNAALSPAARRGLILRFARTAAAALHLIHDPACEEKMVL
ncbi:MAG: MmcB family DNA repair protein [Rhizobiales bacterium]|nr:MmcB family DNA repair protein [Hyphomicrobiales bacterium]